MVAADDLLDTLESLDFPAVALRPGTAEVIRMNAAAANLFGTMTDWLGRVHPSDRASVEHACREGSPHIELRATTDQLKFRHLHIELRRRAEFTLGVVIEVATRSSSEPELEALLEALPFEVWERDADGVLIRQNAMALRNWGARLGSNVDGMGMPSDTVDLWRRINVQALGGETVRHPIDYVVAGKPVNYVNVVAPVRDGDRIRGVVGVNLDVTDTREAERRLSRSLEDLALAQSKLVRRERLAALGELAAVVAHEVRNPLAAIYNSLSALKKQLTFDRSTSVLFGIIEEEAARLNRTVSDLLSYVRPLEPERRPEDLVELTRDVAQLHDGAIELDVIVSEGLEPVSADATLMRIALSNLVTNAMQSMPSGGKLTITLKDVRIDERAAVSIAVRDTGKGIPPDVLPRVFEPFFTTRASGAGLGLAVVRRIVEAHDGVVTVESDASGTVFTVLLPR